MKILDSLNLNEFLKDGSQNRIIIHYNQEVFKSTNPSLPEDYFLSIQGKWLFFEITEGKNEVISFNKHNFYLDDKVFDIVSFYNVIEGAHRKWIKECPLIPFPDICITSNNFNNKSAFLSYDNLNEHHFIYLTLNELSSLERFQYVLGHELGHLYYNIQDKTYIEPKIHLKDFFPWEILIVCLIQLYALVNTIKDSSSNGDFLVQIILFMNFLFWFFYFLINILSMQERLKNYSAEFYSDYFSFFFLGKVEVDRLENLLDGNLNCFTHPSSSYRRYYLKKFSGEPLEKWQNPIFNHKFFFRTMNFYEFSFFISLKIKKAQNKIKNFIFDKILKK